MFTLKFTPEIVPSTDQLPADLIVAICTLRAAVAISEVFVDLKDSPLRKFLYRITADDGRVWKQFLYVPDSNDSSMTFDVPDAWELAEFAPHRDVRDKTIEILRKYTGIQTIKFTSV